jgi:hypothetical protein
VKEEMIMKHTQVNLLSPEEIVGAIYHNGETFVRKGIEFLIGGLKMNPNDAGFCLGYTMKALGEALIQTSKEVDPECILRNADVSVIVDQHMEAFKETLPKPS